MVRIVFVDPQDDKEKHWWPALIVEPEDYDIFFREMGESIEIENDFLVCYFEDASYSSVKKDEVVSIDEYMKSINLSFILEKSSNNNLSNLMINNEHVNLSKEYGESNGNNIKSEVNNKNLESDSIYVFTEFDKDTNKWLNSRSIRNVLKLHKEEKIPFKFKWLKKKNSRKYTRKIKVIEDEDPGIRKKIILERALKDFKNLG